MGLVCALCWASPRVVKANDFEQFEAARQTYESQDYARAAELFEELVGGDVPRLENRSLVIESEKYLGASYLFLSKLDQAEVHVEKLLRLEPEYMLDPLAFPEDVQRLFARVKTRLDSERNAQAESRRAEEERLRREKLERDRKERERWDQLWKLAGKEQVIEERSRVLAMVPFGVGQYQNGHDGMGLVLAVSEGSLLAISIAAYVLHQDLRGQKPSATEINDARLAERAFRYTSQISFGLFAVLAVTGIVDAQLRFVPTRKYERERPLPPDLYGGPELSVGPGNVDLKLRF